MSLGLAMPFFGRSDNKTLRAQIEAEVENTKNILGRMKTVALDHAEKADEVYQTTQGVIERMERLQNDRLPRPPS